MKKKYLLLFGLCIIAPRIFLQAQNPVTKFQHITIKDGLSQSTVETIVKDDIGYMWFGTNDGLNRYDGYELRIFRHDASDPHSISDNYIYHIIKDRNGDLWVGTNNGLNHLDLKTEKFECFRYDKNDSSSLSNNFVHRIMEDFRGNLWIATVGGGLNFLDRDKNAFYAFKHNSGRPQSISENRITALAIDHRDDLWIGTYTGHIDLLPLDQFYRIWDQSEANRYDLKIPFENIRRSISGSEDIIWNISFDRKEHTLISTNRSGVLVYQSNGVDVVPRTFGWSEATSVHTILLDRDDNYWIGTESDGLHLYDPANNTIRKFQKDSQQPWGINDNGIWSLFEDEIGRIWIGTEFGGINIYDPFRHKFKHILLAEENPASDDQAIWAICQDREGIIWLGTEGRGLFSYDPETNTFTSFKNDPSDPASLSYNIVSSLLPVSDGNIWVGTNGGGLNHFNPKTGKFKQYKNDQNNPYSLSNNSVRAMTIDTQDHIWIGTYGGGLNQFDPQKSKFTLYDIGINFISALWYSRAGNLWIGSYGEGLGKYNLTTGNFELYKNLDEDSSSINSDRIYSIFQDSDDIIWIGTANGLNKYHPQQNHFSQYTEADGLPNNVIYTILEDGEKNLWLSTNRGLSKFNITKQVFTNFDPSDGLQDYEYNRNAGWIISDGQMVLGGINGLNIFDPAKITINDDIPEIILTRFLKWNKAVSFNTPLHYQQLIELSFQDKSFGFEFAALDFTAPLKNQYAYQMEGFDEDWIETGNRRFAYYTHLSPGSYRFRVKAANSDGIWNHDGVSIALVISPPFWQTWWFYIISATLLFLGVVSLFRLRIQQRVQRAIELEKVKVVENERIRRKAAQDFHDGLGHKLAKINFLSQTLKAMLKDKHSGGQQYLNKISGTAESLNNDMRNFLWLLDPGKDSLFEIILRLKDFGEELFDKTGITFRVREIPKILDELKLDMDFKRHFLFLFREAMSNVLKHSEAENVEMQFNIVDSIFIISIQDDGQGFNPEINKNGHGLMNMKQRAENLSATLSIDTEIGSGTILTLEIKLPELGGCFHWLKFLYWLQGCY